MNNNEDKANSTHQGWDSFWRGSEAAAFSAGGLHHPSISGFWTHYFKSLKAHYDKPNIIDIASGSGAVVERIHSVYGVASAQLTCLDVSQAAIDRLADKYPNVTGIVADAGKVPAADQSFDVATSQFGVEYAGDGAIPELCRLVAKSGHVALVMHHTDSSIRRECAQNLAAVERVQKSDFIQLAFNFLEAGFAAVAGGDREPYETAATALSGAVEELNKIFEEFGSDAADGTIVKLYSDVDKIHSNMPGYKASEVLEWLKVTERELDAYAIRMRSMCDSALSDEAFKKICDVIAISGFSIEISSALTPGVGQAPLAWVLVANRGPAIIGDNATSTDVSSEQVEAWRQQQIDIAVRTVTDSAAFSSPVLEARPVWSAPYFAMISQVREQGGVGHFVWVISGECPTDTLPSESAATVREAARHFAMKWQLEAARDESGDRAAAAETLFSRVQDDRAWSEAVKLND